MKDNKFIDFFKNNLGFLIGLLIGAIVVVCRITYFFINLIVIGLFGFLRYVCSKK